MILLVEDTNDAYGVQRMLERKFAKHSLHCVVEPRLDSAIAADQEVNCWYDGTTARWRVSKRGF